MKKIKGILLIILSCFAVNVYATSSQFDDVITVSDEVSDNMVRVILAFKGEEINDISLKISYLKDELEFEGISYMEGYYALNQELINDVKWNTIDLNVTSDYLLKGATYAVLNFKKLTNSTNYMSLFFYNYQAKGIDKYTYICDGTLLKVKVINDEVEFITKDIDKRIQFEYWFNEHGHTIFIAIIVVVLLVLIIFLMPSGKKENRKKKLKQKIANSQESFKIMEDIDKGNK